MGMVIRKLWVLVLVLRLRLATGGHVRLGAALELRLRLMCRRGDRYLCRGCDGA